MPSRSLDDIRERFNVSEQDLENRHSEWKSYWKLYKSYVDEDKLSTISNLFIPVTFTAIETLMPRIVSAITGSQPMISTKPRSPDDVESAKVLESLQQYQLMKMNFEQELIPTLRDSLIMDVGVGKVQWARTNRYRGPMFDYLSPFEIFPDPHAKDRDDAKYIIQRYFVDKETLQDWRDDEKVGSEAGGQPLKKIKGSAGIREDGDAQEIRLKSTGRSKETDTTRDWFEIWEYWEDDNVQFVANGETIIRDEKNPYDHGEKPFHFFADYPKGDEIFGQGEVENIEDLQHEVNVKRNQRIDSVNMQLSPPIIQRPTAFVDDEQIVAEPYAVWEMNPDDIQFAQLPDITPPAVREEQLAINNIKEATSITSVVQGISSENNPNTATGFQMLDQNAAARFTLKVRSFEKPVQDIAHQMHQLNMQFINEQKTIRIVGETSEEIEDRIERKADGKFKFLSFDPEEIKGEFDFIAQGAKSETLKQRQQKMVQILNAIAPIATEVNIKEIFRELLRSFNVKNPDRFLEVPEEQVQRVQGGPEGQPQEGRAPAQSENNERPANAGRGLSLGQEQARRLGEQSGGLEGLL